LGNPFSMKTKTVFLSGTNLTPANPPRATIDFETRSAADIKKVGAWIYSLHPSTEVMCLSIRLPHWPKARLWANNLEYSWGRQDHLDPEALEHLFDWIEMGGLVEAHNVFFERAIWRNICAARMGWPSVDESQWRCSAAKASSHSLPRALGPACEALDLPVKKDGIGRKAMLKLCKPRQPRKAEKELLLRREEAIHDQDYDQLDDIEAELRSSGWDHQYFWNDSIEDLETLFSYCCTDTDSEHGLSEALPDLPPSEQRIWEMDQGMNLRGVLIDRKLAETALDLVAEAEKKMLSDLRDLTGDETLTARSRERIKAWLASQNMILENTQGATLDEWLDPYSDKHKALLRSNPRAQQCLSVLRIVREVNRTSTAKYSTALRMIAPDNRIRDLMMYHGASTGRWAGKGLQPHNFPRGWVKDMEEACDIVLTGDLKFIQAMYGEVIDLLSSTLRGMFVATPGRDFMVADYSAIEARVIAWLAHEDEALRVFASGQCIYMDMATSIYGYQVNNKVAQADERQMGKQAILGLGFGMGFVTFWQTCRKYNITFTEGQCKSIVGDQWTELKGYVESHMAKGLDGKAVETNKKARHTRRTRIEDEGYVFDEILHELILMKFIVDAYRKKYKNIVRMWSDVEAAAVKAIDTGKPVKSKLGRCEFAVEGRFLKCYLPSGRALYYCDPILVNRTTPWGEKRKVIYFMGMDPYTKKWCKQSTYGGKLVENVTQATARDIMAEAMVAADEGGEYDVLLSVHDELIAEVDEGVGSVEEFEELMARQPAWAEGCPIQAEGWRGKRYRK
jgi:DNA polymerase bacteriophage-type